jgi:hypothetical protein
MSEDVAAWNIAVEGTIKKRIRAPRSKNSALKGHQRRIRTYPAKMIT